ncbi:MAG: hypothetical protein U5R14_04735 [Gemmatimonadota bacterium]|nr:hypothetical protein [Gemmatimonadota bacterium]
MDHLSEFAQITGADRAAAVWIDEYSEGGVHPHVVLDLLSDRPRRAFPREPLERAWELGLPGTYEAGSSSNRHDAEASSCFAVALGSDGARAWFLVSDSVGPRPWLTAKDRERAMFLSGECASALLHRDLDELSEQPKRNGRGFVGLPVLDDCEGREDRPEVTAKVEQRFLVVRLTRALIDGELDDAPEDTWRERLDTVRAEVGKRVDDGGDAEDRWAPVLDAVAGRTFVDLADALLHAGRSAETEGHVHGALELYRCAYDAAATVMHAGAAVDAARCQGRVQRRLARWEDSVRQYQLAHDVAVAAELWERAARVLVGLASVRREVGNIPDARREHVRALEFAERCGDADTVATVHHGILTVEHVAGNLDVALQHGWSAVSQYEDESGRMRCLASLAGVLLEFGDRTASEDAWTVVAERTADLYYRIYARDALAYLAALRGDLEGFQRQAALCDALDWESGPLSAKAEILYYRGKSFRALGLRDTAKAWLERAVTFAEEHGFNRTLFEAEDELKMLEQENAVRNRAAEDDAANTTPAAPPEIRDGLREMRRAVAASGS